MSLFSKENKESSMNLPVNSHIERLSELMSELKYDVESAQKDLHILRGQITELSFVNKESDQELNEFLVESISSLRQRWAGDWEKQKDDILLYKKKVSKMFEDHEDVDIIREEIEEKVENVEHMVGNV